VTTKNHRGLGLAAGIVALPLLFGALPVATVSADTGGQDARPTPTKQTGAAKRTGRGTPKSSSRIPSVDVGYPSYLPELSPTQKAQLQAELAKVPPYLRGTATVYIVHKLWPEYFSPGVLLAPNPMAGSGSDD